MNQVKIKKAKIKDSIFLEVEYTEELPGHSKKDTKLSCTVPVHQDLKDSFQKLHKHLALICDQLPIKGKSIEKFDHEDLSLFTVTGFTLRGGEDKEGVVISGHMEGKFGIVNLNTPFTKYDDDEYPFTDELAEDIQAAVYEVEEYLFNGKKAPDRQLSLDFGEEFEEEQAEEFS